MAEFDFYIKIMKDEDYDDYHCQGKILSHFKKFSDSCLAKSHCLAKWICLVIFILAVISFLVHNAVNEECHISSFNSTCKGNCSETEWETMEEEHCTRTSMFKTSVWKIIWVSISMFIVMVSLSICCLLKHVLKSRAIVGIENEKYNNKVSASDYW